MKNYPTNRKKVLIYKDEGADPFSVACLYSQLSKSLNGVDVRFVDAKTINNKKDWDKNTIALVLPGGRDLPYAEKLGENGCRNIRKFVENGGSYIGICAGAYFGCQNIEWKNGHKDGFAQSRELSFLKGKAEGPLKNLSPTYKSNYTPASMAQVKWENGETAAIYYHDGPCFYPDKESEILAEYSSSEKNVIAAVKCNVGKGCAVLCGVHPEITGEQILNEGYEYVHDREIPKDIAAILKTGEEGRKKFWNQMLTKANLPIKKELLPITMIKEQKIR